MCVWGGGIECTYCAQFRQRPVELPAKRMMHGRWGFFQVKNKAFRSVVVMKVVKNQVPT